MSKHTPGPWKWVGDEMLIGDKGETVIYPSYTYGGETWVDVSKADAKLIASAPDLLEALEFALQELSDMTTDEFSNGNDQFARRRMKAAIAKATDED